ncbi:MAG: hypothetical protein KC668_11555 [Myxococcales bacterium]|nr:hypothetical protein [Myxococcales bacterium]
MTRHLTLATIAFALLGLFFASYATYDFASHLDRQVHGIHCSFLPGVEAAGTESSGCQVTLMSRYSSVFRTQLWGGIPISLPGMALFAFLAFWGGYLALTGRHSERTATAVTLGAWALPLLTSCVMGYLALVELDAACKLCIGIYTSSALGFAAAAALVWAARKVANAPAQTLAADATAVDRPVGFTGSADTTISDDGSSTAAPALRREGALRSVAFALPVAGAFMTLPIAGYVAAMPDYSAYEGGCGELAHPEAPDDLWVPLGGSSTGHPAIEVLDPLCPSCKGLEARLTASGLDAQLDRRAVLFPLDDSCNWMVTRAVHPGACAVSEAMLCEPEQARAVLGWAFEHQEEITAAEQAHEGAAARMVSEQFPSVRRCVGSTRVRQRLNRGLRWAVSNQIPVLTPQLFVDGRKVCNEDTDLGLEYTLTQMLTTPTSAAGGAP